MAPQRKADGFGPSPDVFVAVPHLAVALNVFYFATCYLSFNGEGWMSVGDEMPIQLSLFGGYGVVLLLWSALAIQGLVGPGTGAGFRLAALAITARVLSTLAFLSMSEFAPDGATYVGPATTTGLVWALRNGSLVAYAFGLTLVVLSTAVELRRRRTVPAWTRPAD